MNTARPNFTWPVLVIGVGVLMLLIAAETLPEAYGDLLVRAWPVLLIMFGLNVLLAGRIRFANWAILVLSVGVVIVIANFAYAERSTQYRDDYRESWQDTVPDGIEQIIVNIETKDTLVALSNAAEPRQVQVFFEGSTESNLDISLEIEGSVAVFNVIESRSGILPRLAEVGRGQAEIYLPWGVFVQELNFSNDDGPVTLDLTALAIRWVDATIDRGNVQLCLPERVSTKDFVMIGNQLTTNNGDVRIVIPGDVSVQLGTNRTQEPEYIPIARQNDYAFLFEGVLETRNVNNNQFDVFLDVNADGALTLDHEMQCQQS